MESRRHKVAHGVRSRINPTCCTPFFHRSTDRFPYNFDHPPSRKSGELASTIPSTPHSSSAKYLLRCFSSEICVVSATRRKHTQVPLSYCPIIAARCPLGGTCLPRLSNASQFSGASECPPTVSRFGDQSGSGAVRERNTSPPGAARHGSGEDCHLHTSPSGKKEGRQRHRHGWAKRDLGKQRCNYTDTKVSKQRAREREIHTQS